MNTIKVIFIRHGKSQWNQDNRFTGWVDIDLSHQGKIEAKNAGQLLKKHKFFFNYGYTSMLKRAIHTLWIVLDQLDQSWLPIKKNWQLNERHYGALQGWNKDQVIKKYGNEIVQKWRRGFKDIPPKNNIENDQFLGTNDIRYNNIEKNKLPNGESLELTAHRVMSYWKNYIVPNIKNSNQIIVVAHGNSIRSIIKFLDHLDDNQICSVEIPTGIPLIYEFNETLKPTKHYYLK